MEASLPSNHLVQLLIDYRYWILIPLSFIEGPVVAFVAGALSHLGYFNPYFAFSILFFKDVILDIIFYSTGYFGGETKFVKKLLSKLGVKKDDIDEVRILWTKHGFKTMFFSKLSYGLSAGFLMVAGVVNMSFKVFLRYAILVAVTQYLILFILGFNMGSAFGDVANVLNNIQYVVGAVLIFATGYYIFARYMRNRLIKEEEEIKEEEKIKKE